MTFNRGYCANVVVMSHYKDDVLSVLRELIKGSELLNMPFNPPLLVLQYHDVGGSNRSCGAVIVFNQSVEKLMDAMCAEPKAT